MNYHPRDFYTWMMTETLNACGRQLTDRDMNRLLSYMFSHIFILEITN
jgi:hypothetical protein